MCVVTGYQTGKTSTLNLQYGEPTGIPDLVISNFESTGPVICDWMTEKAHVPIRFIISNLGEAQSDSFNVEIEQSWDGEAFELVCFRDPNHSDPDPFAPDWCYPSTDTALTSGSTVTFAGEVTAYYLVHGPFFLRAKADSGYCGLNPHDYCRIQESNEDNNKSSLLSLSCP